MRVRMLAVLAVCLLLTGIVGAKAEGKLEGTWVVVSLVRDGKADDNLKDLEITFADGKFTTRKDDKPFSAGTFKADSTKKPMTIDTMYTSEGPNKGKGRKGIYEMDGTALKICFSDLEGDRPTEFASKEGTKQLFFTLKKK